jgi:hypothetical protein
MPITKVLARILVVCAFVLAGSAAIAKETAEAAKVLDRAVEAIGGEKVVFQTLTLVVKGESARITASGHVKSPTTTYFSFPMSIRQEIVVEGKTIAMASTPEGAFLESEGGVQELPEAGRHSLEASAMRNPVALLKGRHGRFFEATYAGKERIGETEVDMVDIRIGPNATLLAVDAQGRMVEQRYDSLSENGRKGRMVVRFGDFRPDGGFIYPHKVRAEFDGTSVFEGSVAEVQRDRPLDVRLFAAGLGSASAGRSGVSYMK